MVVLYLQLSETIFDTSILKVEVVWAQHECDDSSQKNVPTICTTDCNTWDVMELPLTWISFRCEGKV